MIRRQKSKKKEFLSDKISSLFTVAPSADVEDDQVFGTKPKTVTRDELDSDSDYEETALSDFKKRNVALLSELSDKYAGEVASRNDLEESDEPEPTDDESDANESDKVESDANESNKVESDADGSMEYQYEESDGDEEGSSDAVESEEGFDLSQLNESEQDTFTHMKETNVSEENSKGNCVKNQLSIWENALEMRISMQKCIVAANKMPLSDTFKELKKDDKFNAGVSRVKGNLTELLSKLVDLQSNLLEQYPETKNLFNKSKSPKKNVEIHSDEDDEEIPSDSDSVSSDKEVPVPQKKSKKRKFTDITKDLAERHVTYAKYRNSVIQKWHDKTRLTTSHQKNAQPTSSTLTQIEFLLGDMNKMVKRTQLKRSKYDIIGQNTEESNYEVVEGDEPPKDPEIVDEYCTEIFDDDDFYHQLLRELIEHKSADVSDPVQLSRQWITLQQLRSKMKRKIDTRATKGRRIRYAVHSKLVNFMAPQRCIDWTEEGKNELFASLFGKNYEEVGKSIGHSNDGGLTIMK